MMPNMNPALAATFRPPVMEARRWLDGVTFPPGRPLLNLSQAAPVEPPPEGLRRAMAEAALSQDSAHLYGPVLGNDNLREALAREWRRGYGGSTGAANVAITQGCNQAFCAAIATLAGAGDEVILPAPWYFNHRMWLEMQGITTVPLACRADMVPRAEDAAALITARTRAIVLVSPNNPTGAEYPAETLGAFYDLCRAAGIALIIDETYRDFDSREGAPHDLATREGAEDTLIQLYSFSKAYRLTGHRTGALITGARRMIEVEKFLDTVAICPGQMGQIGALWGVQNLRDWLAGERAEILARRAAMVQAMAKLDEWRLVSAGAYFAWVQHPFDMPSDQVAQMLVREAGLLVLPGTMFSPEGQGKDALRIAFANADGGGIAEMADRLASLTAG
ncbi:MAG: aminotransferase [Paracoccus sp. (in: a-proteobacteria)]|nr:aminotransferase [Paracoccus sp. (in: a-proteobacteria)]